MSPAAWKVAGALALVLLGAISAWKVQGWQYRAQLTEQSRLHTDTLNQLAMLGSAIALPFLICGCQSSLTKVQTVAFQCLPPPVPAAWFMEPFEPNLPQRMLNELSPSPMKVIGD